DVLGIYGPRAQEALGERVVSTHELPPGEPAKQQRVVERLWSELTIDRTGTVVALGGGALTDAAGFAAATYLRGVPWVAVPTTLVGHGEAVALGLVAALELSGRDPAPVREALDPQPVQVDRERAWQALQRDKKREGDAINLVLLADDGPYVEARPAVEVRAALDTLIR